MRTVARTMAWVFVWVVLVPAAHAAAQEPAAARGGVDRATVSGPKAADECNPTRRSGRPRPPVSQPLRESAPEAVNWCAPVINIGAAASAVPFVTPPCCAASNPAAEKDAKEAAAAAVRKAAEDKASQTEFNFEIGNLLKAGFKSKDGPLVYVCVATFLVLLCLFAGTYVYRKVAKGEEAPKVSSGSVALWLLVASGAVLAFWFVRPVDVDQRRVIAELETIVQRRVVEATEARTAAAVKAALDAQSTILRAEMLLQNAPAVAQRPAPEKEAGVPVATLLLGVVCGMVATTALVVLASMAGYFGSLRRDAASRSSENPRTHASTPKKSSSATRRTSRLLAAIFEAQDAAIVFLAEMRKRLVADASAGAPNNELRLGPLLAALGALQWHLEVQDDLRHSPAAVVPDSGWLIKGTAAELESVRADVEQLTATLGQRDDLSAEWRREASGRLWELRRKLLSMSQPASR